MDIQAMHRLLKKSPERFPMEIIDAHRFAKNLME